MIVMGILLLLIWIGSQNVVLYLENLSSLKDKSLYVHSVFLVECENKLGGRNVDTNLFRSLLKIILELKCLLINLLYLDLDLF